MDPSILKGESGASKKQKVGWQEFAFRDSGTDRILLQGGICYLHLEKLHIYFIWLRLSPQRRQGALFSV